MISATETIAHRLKGLCLDPGEWTQWGKALSAGSVTDYQHTALLSSLSFLPLSEAEQQDIQGVIDVGDCPDIWNQVPGTGTPALDGTWPEESAPLPTLLQKKHHGRALSKDEIELFVKAVSDNSASDAQIASFTSGVFHHGMTPEEVATLTQAMTFSGELLDIGDVDGPIVDKHSTGGVGDKVSLPLAAVLAAGGCYVPMVSGRGLGHTGGTLDKLQAIPGYRVDLAADEMAEVVQDVGCSIVGQTKNLAPADKRIYAIRDVTATVSSIPLITASILSKKLAEDLELLLMDVKVGSGAFMPSLEGARALAKSLTEVGEAVSRTLPERPGRRPLRVQALLTAMDRPLGRMIGHTLEIIESIDCLKGGGPADLREVVVKSAGRVFAMGRLAQNAAEGEALAASFLDNGQAFQRFRQMVQAQGGDPAIVDHPDALEKAPFTLAVKAPRAGTILKMDALTFGKALIPMGGGRKEASDKIDFRVGFEILHPLGSSVAQGEAIILIHSASQATAEEAHEALHTGLEIGDGTPQALPLIIEEIP